MKKTITKKTLKTPAKTPAKNSLDQIISDLATAALQKVKDKPRFATVDDAVAASLKAGQVTAEAIKDCVFTPEEVNLVADAYLDAALKIAKAVKKAVKKAAKKGAK